MKFRAAILSLIALFSVVSPLRAQDGFKSLFQQANVLMEEKFYNEALEIWMELWKQDSTNANLSYKVGVCLFNNSTERKNALKYFKIAEQNISKRYDVFSHTEKGSPLETHYYLGRTRHLNNQIDQAIAQFNIFQAEVHKKHFLQEDTRRQLEMCATAKELMANPVQVNITPLSRTINTDFPEYSPVISLDENTVYFTSRRLRKDSSNANSLEISDKLYYEDIYVSYRDSRGIWSEPELININRSDDHDATIGISADGQNLFIYKDLDGNGALFMSKKENGQWSSPELLGSDINTNYYETHVTVSADGNRLYFVSDRKGGHGGKDIYRCIKLPNGEWSAAQNLGPTINTPHDEDGPFIHPDDRTLYFSSNGHKTMGGYDIFFSKLQDDSTWSAPENIGYPINTTGDDVFYVTSPDGKRGYYSSAKEGGEGKTDLYLIERPEEEEVEVDLGGFALLKGYILSARGVQLPENARIIISDNRTGLKVGEAKPVKRTGSFVFIIPAGKDYHINYFIDEENYFEEDIAVPVGTEYKEIKREILLRPLRYGDPSETEVIVLMDDLLDDNKKWQLIMTDATQQVPLGLKMNYLDNSGNIVHTEYVSKDGFFRYHALSGDDALTMQLVNEDDIPFDNLSIQLMDEGKVQKDEKEEPVEMLATEEYVFKTREEIEKAKLLAAKLENERKKQEVANRTGDQETPKNGQFGNQLRPGQTKFEEYFGYNKNRIDPKEKRWIDFIDKLEEIAEVNGKVNISIDASASRVPTQTYITNDSLSEIRAQRARDLVTKAMRDRGVPKDKVRFIRTTALVQGPNYKKDAYRREFYRQFQYVRITGN